MTRCCVCIGIGALLGVPLAIVLTVAVIEIADGRLAPY